MINSMSMRRIQARVRRKSWTAISGVLALVVIACPTAACRRKNAIPPPPPAKSQPLPEEQPPFGQSSLVLVWMETTPPGARIVRVSDGHVLGYSPEIIEFSYTKTPVPIRFELEGYVALAREVSAASDVELKVVLEPLRKVDLSAAKKSKGSKAHGHSD
jgi:hypothetical protein